MNHIRRCRRAAVLGFALLGCEEGTVLDDAVEPAEDAGSRANEDGGKPREPAADDSQDLAEAGAPYQADASSGCEDEYPYDDGYTCPEQASWGKCDEPWLLGYCNDSCNRCGASEPGAEPEQPVSFAGPRDVFESYTEKEPLAPTPPMGWNSWNRFGCNIDARLIVETAEAMVASGMQAVGYEYVNIDDCWQAPERDADGKLVPDPIRFPAGMKAVADQVHDLGLKLGIYSDRGTRTCAGFPGSYDHELQDAETFAEWGVDYVKYDNCAIPTGREGDPEMREDYAIMGEALRRAGRPIVYSICAWWFYPWMPELGHLWRTTTDIKDIWSDDHHSVTRLLNWSGGDTDRYGAFNASDFDSGAYPAPGLARYAGPSAWNDPDMLEVGNGGMTDTEYRSHFSLWALMAAPLIAGNDLRDMSDATIEILTNEEVIAVNQDALGAQGVPISESTTLEVWAKPLAEAGTHAVILFNRTEAEESISVRWDELGLDAASASMRDLWAREDLGSFDEAFTAAVPAHGVVMLRVSAD